VQAAWTAKAEMPADNAAAAIPPRDKIVGNLVKDVNVDGGAITLTYGNNAGKALDGKRVTLRPAIVADQPLVPIAWICHDVPVPNGMEIRGRDETDIPSSQLPLECRGSSPK
jgi:type IV pilus assembly protein PilA